MKRPLKRKGALPAPIPLIQSPQSKAGNAFPQRVCKHEVTRTERLPEGHLHYAELSCVICGVHLRWLPHHRTVERQELNAFKIAKLAMRSDLNDYERGFIKSVSRQRKLSPKQQALLVRLCMQYLQEAP